MNKEEVKQILLQNNITVKKKYGQNFLLDESILNNIVLKSNIKENSYIVEIGPGLGFLTKKLSQCANKVLCYEIDEQMVNILVKENYNNVEIIKDDFLKRNLDEDFLKFAKGKKIMIISNLPYYITTAILLKILEETHYVDKMIVMMQKEVAQRICGKPSTKDYNALSVLLQYFTIPKILFDIKPSSFYPQPNVDSSVVEIVYKKEIVNKALNLNYFLQFNRNIFFQRRKTLINNVQKAYDYDKSEIEKLLCRFHISSSIRAEELSVNQIVDIANTFYEHFEENKRTN
jgi:16S rRNA (adenine1518-N6/adenine1519-N6)-dimethyltransferase